VKENAKKDAFFEKIRPNIDKNKKKMKLILLFYSF